MVVLYLPDPLLPHEDEYITAVDWQVSTDSTFSNSNEIVAESLNDGINLYGIVFNITIDVNEEYYARARIKTNKDVYDWSNIAVLVKEDYIGTSYTFTIPSIVNKPNLIKLENLSKLEGSTLGWTYGRNSNFAITTSPFSTTGNGIHESTTYIIKDSFGQIYYTDIDNKEELTYKEFTDVILDYGKTYVIEVYYKSSSGDVSEPLTIYYIVPRPILLEPETRYIDILRQYKDYTYILDVNENHIFKFNRQSGLEAIRYEFYGYKNSVLVRLYNKTFSTKNSELTIPRTAINKLDTKEYLIGISVKTYGKWKPMMYLKMNKLSITEL